MSESQARTTFETTPIKISLQNSSFRSVGNQEAGILVGFRNLLPMDFFFVELVFFLLEAWLTLNGNPNS
jgi:hypothetical protein